VLSNLTRLFKHVNVLFAELRIGMPRIVLIGGITGYRFGNDGEVMAEWKAARQIPRRPRIVDSGRITPPVTPPSDVRPAA